jgi:hypothetical protein
MNNIGGDRTTNEIITRIALEITNSFTDNSTIVAWITLSIA